MLGLGAALIIATFVFGMPAVMAGKTALLGALTGLLPIGWIILNVIFLYKLSELTGRFKILQDSIAGITNDRRLQLLLVAFAFGAFFEGASGFGTIWPAVLVTGVTFAVPQFLMSNYHVPTLVDIVASLVSMACLAGFLKVWRPKSIMLGTTRDSEFVSPEEADKRMVRRTHTSAEVISAWLPWIILCVIVLTATNWYGHESEILRYVFFHSLALACLMGMLVMAQACVYPFTSMVLH